MNITLAGKTYRIEQIHTKANGKIQVMLEQDGRAIVTYQGNPKYYICSRTKARELWAKA